MANIIRGNGGTGLQRDPFSIARDLLGLDPLFHAVDWPTRTREPATFTPTFNVVEKADAYFISADLPGMKEEDLDVTVQDNYLLISGSRSAEQRQEGDSYYLYERRFGNFSRTFALPDNADPEKIDADLKNGVLELRVAKRESARPRKVTFGQRVREKLTGEKPAENK